MFSKDKWFDIAATGGAAELTAMVGKHAGSFESRTTNAAQAICNGWAAIHVACFRNNAPCVQALLERELDLVTQAEAVLRVPGMGADTWCAIPPGATALMLAILGAAEEATKVILAYIEARPAAISHLLKPSADGRLTLSYAIMCGGKGNKAAQLVMRTTAIIQMEFASSRALWDAARYGRVQIMEAAEAMWKGNQYLIAQLLLSRGQQMGTIVEWAKQPIDRVKYCVDDQELEQTHAKLQKLLQLAFEFAKSQGFTQLTGGLSFEDTFGGIGCAASQLLREQAQARKEISEKTKISDTATSGAQEKPADKTSDQSQSGQDLESSDIEPTPEPEPKRKKKARTENWEAAEPESVVERPKKHKHKASRKSGDEESSW